MSKEMLYVAVPRGLGVDASALAGHVGANEGADVVGAGVVGTKVGPGLRVGARVPKQSRNAKASIIPAPSFPP